LPILGRGKIAGHHLADYGKVTEIDQVDIELDHIGQRAAGCFGDRSEVVEHPRDLRLDAALDQCHGGGVQGNLAGQVDGVAGPDRLGIGADGGGRTVGVDHGLVGHRLPQFLTRWTEHTCLRVRMRRSTLARCTRLRAAITMLTTLAWVSRSPTLMRSMVASCSLTRLARVAMMPRSDSTTSLSSTGNSPLTVGDHCSGMHFSRLSRMPLRFLQDSR